MANEKKKKAHSDVVREQPMNYEEYSALPEDDNRYELVDGVLELMSPSATPSHQFISTLLTTKFMSTCQNDYIVLHDVDVILSEYEVRRPDIVMIRRDRLAIITNRGIKGPPDLVVEILSPSSIKRDKLNKLQAYAYFSIYEYWIVDPFNAALEQYLLTDSSYELSNIYTEDELVQSERLPCISFTMNDIMARMPDFADE